MVRSSERGFAVLMVIAVIAALAMVAAPFAISMRFHEQSSRGLAGRVRARRLARTARNRVMARLIESHPEFDRADQQGSLGGNGNPDVDDLDELRPLPEPVSFSDPDGTQRLSLRSNDSRGDMFSAEVEDELSKLDINSAGPLALSNLLGVSVLMEDLDEDSTEIPIESQDRFFSDGDPRSIDGYVRIDSEYIAYRHIEPAVLNEVPVMVLRGCIRGYLFSGLDPQNLVHLTGSLVRDGRGEKLAFHPVWRSLGRFTPMLAVPGIKEIAEWELVDVQAMLMLFRQGMTFDELRRYRINASDLIAAGINDPEALEFPEETDEERERVDEVFQGAGVDLRETRKLLSPPQLHRVAERFERVPASRMEAASQKFAERLEQMRERRVILDKWRRRALADQVQDIIEARERARHMETIGREELAELRRFLTVHSHGERRWGPTRRARNFLEYSVYSSFSNLVIRDPRGFCIGATVRVVGGGGSPEYATVVRNRNGQVTLFPQLERDYAPYTAQIQALEPSPVNVNSAPPEVLRAVFTGLRSRGQIAGTLGGTGPDLVTPREAQAVAVAILGAGGAIGGFEEFAGILQALESNGDISQNDVDAILRNAVNPSDEMLLSRTVPLDFRSRDIYTVVSHGVVNDPAGGEVARVGVREVVDVAPPGGAMIRLESQADFSGQILSRTPNGRGVTPLALPGRRSHEVLTLPRPIDLAPWLFPDASRAGDVGEVRVITGKVEERNPTFVEHFDDDPDGQEGGSLLDQGSIPSVPAVVGGVQEQHVAPGSFEMWFRPADWQPNTGARVLFDAGERDNVNRLVCFYDTGTQELVLGVGDPALDLRESIALGVSPRMAEVRALLPLLSGPGPDLGIRNDNWYHIQATWKGPVPAPFPYRGSLASDLVMFLDGRPLGQPSHVTRLTAAVSADSIAIQVEDTTGFPDRGVIRIGSGLVGKFEVLEFVRKTITTFEARQIPNPALNQPQPPTPPGQPPPPPLPAFVRATNVRGTQPLSHESGALVQVFGYTEFLEENLRVGQALTVSDLPDITPYTAIYPFPGVPPPLPTLPGTPPPPLPVLATDTAIPCLTVDRFPLRGLIQIDSELVYYAGVDLATRSFTGCIRGVEGTTAVDHDLFEPVVLASLEVSDVSDYADGPPASTGSNEVRIALMQPDGVTVEWLNYRKVADPQIPAPERLFMLPPVKNGGALRGGIGGALRAEHVLLQAAFLEPPQNHVLSLLAQTIGQALAAAELNNSRSQNGTQPQIHAIGTRVLPVFEIQNTNQANNRLVGTDDKVTFWDLTGGTPEREERVVSHAGRGGGLSGGQHVSLDGFATRQYEAALGGRLSKWPTGELPVVVPAALSVGQARPPSGPNDLVALAPGDISGDVDEIRLGIAVPIVFPLETGLLAGDSLVGLSGNVPQAMRQLIQGGVVGLMDEELVVARDISSDGVEILRGCLGTLPVDHPAGTSVWMLVAYPMVAIADGPFTGNGGEFIPVRAARARQLPEKGYLALDRGLGGGLLEVLPYVAKQGNGAFRRGVDERGRGVFRGGFGSPLASGVPAPGDVLFSLPFRHHGRYQPARDSLDAVMVERAERVEGAWFESVTWDEEVPGAYNDVVVLVRIDGSPDWSAQPSNQPGGLYRFDDPAAPNWLGVRGDQIELRIHFPFKDGAFLNDAWKTGPRLEAVRISYRKPFSVRSHEELNE